MGPPDDGPILVYEDVRLGGDPPATIIHRHVPFLKAPLKLSTPHLPSDTLYNDGATPLLIKAIHDIS